MKKIKNKSNLFLHIPNKISLVENKAFEVLNFGIKRNITYDNLQSMCYIDTLKMIRKFFNIFFTVYL